MMLIDKITKFVGEHEDSVFNTLLGSAVSIVGFGSAWPQDPGTQDKFLYSAWGYGGAILGLYGVGSIINELYKTKYGKSIGDIEIWK